MRLDDLFDVGKQDGPERVSDQVLTVPNVLSFARLCALPFVWADITAGRFTRALVLVAVFASTDWIDGWVARRFDQVTRLGQLLDPISDRILVVVVATALMVEGLLPLWLGGAILLRDVLVGSSGLAMLVRGRRPPPVTRLGKTATAGLLLWFPLLLVAAAVGDADAPGRSTFELVALAGLTVSAVLYWAAASAYARGLRAARVTRDDG